MGSTCPSASVNRMRCTNRAGSSRVLSRRLATSSFIVSTRSSTNTRRDASNGVREDAATTGSATSSVRITCAPVGRTQVRSGCEPAPTRRRTPIGVGLALGQQLGREGPGRGALADAGGSVEEIRVRGPALQRGRKRHPRLRLVLGAGQRRPLAHAPPPAADRRPGARHRRQHVGVHILRRAVGGDPAPAPRSGGGHPRVGVAHRLLQARALALEPVGLRAPRHRRRGVELQQQRQVGLQPSGGEPVDALDLLHARAPAPRPGRPARSRGSGPRPRFARTRARER